MKITLLIMEGNNRLKLGGKNKIVYAPKRDFQLIIGTNGGGKTTMQQGLSLLPADAKDYDQGGMQEVHAEHNGNFYIARSTFNGTPKHEFFKNGVNLNKGFTLTVQKELVKNETGMTPELHELLTDQVKFTSMNAQQRRWWITRFCSTDLTHANHTYQKAKTKLTQTSGALKHVNARIAAESNRLLEMTDIEDIDKRINVIRVMLDTLTETSTGKKVNTDYVYSEIERSIQNVESLSRSVLRNKMDKPFVLDGIYTLSDAVNRVNQMTNDLAAKGATLKALTDEYAQHASLREMVTDGKPESIEFIQGKLDVVTAQLNEIRKHPNYKHREEDCEFLLRTVKGFLGNLNALISEVTSIEHFMTPIEANELLGQIDDEKSRVSSIQGRLRQLEERREHIHLSEENTCPSCQYVWKPGISEHELEDVSRRIDKGYLALEEANGKLNLLLTKQESANAVLRVYGNFRTLINVHSYLSASLDEIRWVDLNNRRGEIVSMVEYLIHSITLSKDEALLDRQHHQYQDAIEHARLIQHAQSMQQSDRYRTLELNIQSVTQDISELKMQIKDVNTFLTHISKEDKKVEEIVSLWNNIVGCIQDYVVGNVENAIQHDITMNQGALGQLQRKLNEKNMVESIVASLEADKEQLMLTEAAIKLLLKELSPTEGLIAEQLYGSIIAIVKEMNKVIARIWTYSLIIKPCSTENDDLDYKFPMMVEHAGVVRSDVSKGSSSMKDVVNYAFKRLAYIFENLQNFPLFLDEFGNRFDPEHLNRAMNHIQNQAEIGEYSQIFMISHFENYYSGFPSSDITLLHDGNVSLSVEHNQCIEIS